MADGQSSTDRKPKRELSGAERAKRRAERFAALDPAKLAEVQAKRTARKTERLARMTPEQRAQWENKQSTRKEQRLASADPMERERMRAVRRANRSGRKEK